MSLTGAEMDALPLMDWLRLQPGCCPECGTRADLVARDIVGHAPGCSMPAPNPEGMTPVLEGVPVHLRNEVARRGIEDVELPEPLPLEPKPRVPRPW